MFVARDGLLVEIESPGPTETDAPEMPIFLERDSDRHDYGTRDLRAGFTLELSVRLESLDAGLVLLDNRMENGKGFCVRIARHGTLEILLNDGRSESAWACDPDLLKPGEAHHIGVVVDGGPKVITFTVDGALCDGGEYRQFGWGRYNPNLRDVNGGEKLRTGKGVTLVRIYGRSLMTSELIGNRIAGESG